MVECFVPGAEPVVMRVADVRAGHLLRVFDGTWAEVRCVVLSPCHGSSPRLRRVGDSLEISEWHPVHVRNAWHFPAVVGVQIERVAAHVFNFVMGGVHVLLVGGVPCVTLGHGLLAPVACHPFWGSDSVLERLRADEGWENGRVVLREPLRE